MNLSLIINYNISKYCTYKNILKIISHSPPKSYIYINKVESNIFTKYIIKLLVLILFTLILKIFIKLLDIWTIIPIISSLGVVLNILIYDNYHNKITSIKTISKVAILAFLISSIILLLKPYIINAIYMYINIRIDDLFNIVYICISFIISLLFGNYQLTSELLTDINIKPNTPIKNKININSMVNPFNEQGNEVTKKKRPGKFEYGKLTILNDGDRRHNAFMDNKTLINNSALQFCEKLSLLANTFAEPTKSNILKDINNFKNTMEFKENVPYKDEIASRMFYHNNYLYKVSLEQEKLIEMMNKFDHNQVKDKHLLEEMTKDLKNRDTHINKSEDIASSHREVLEAYSKK